MNRLLLCFTLAITACGGSSSHSSGVDGSITSHGDAGTQGGTDAGGVTGGASSYCGLSDSTECVCSNMAYDGLTLGQSCTSSSVASPSLCCARSGWPAQGAGFGCVCSQIFCAVSEFGDTCSCSFAVPDSTDKPIATCTGFGPVCCRSRDDIAPICACYTDLTVCPDDQETVSSCGTEDVLCESQTLSSCS